MFIIRYTPPSDLDLEGSCCDLQKVVAAITSMTSDSSELVFEADAEHDPQPYQRCLAGFKIRASDGPTRVSVANELVVVDGSMENLDIFASFCGIHPGGHTHYEYFTGNTCIAEDSIPLVISARHE